MFNMKLLERIEDKIRDIRRSDDNKKWVVVVDEYSVKSLSKIDMLRKLKKKYDVVRSKVRV